MTQLLVKTIANFQTQLAATAAVGATSLTLQSATDLDGIALPTATYGMTVDEGSSTEEHFTATVTGVNLTNVQHVTRGTGVGTSGLALAHRLGAQVKITDHPAIKRIMNVLDGTTDFDAGTPLEYDGTASITTSNQLATKAYADSLAIAGAPDAATSIKGIARISVAPASPTIPITVGDNDPRVPTQAENDAMVGTSGAPSTSNKYVTNDDVSNAGVSAKIVRLNGTTYPAGSGVNITGVVLNSQLKFGGTGADGALNTTGGAVAIDFGSNSVVVKNYTSITIAINNLTTSNPATNGSILYLKSQGDVTISASVVASGMGGLGAPINSAGAGNVGLVGTGGLTFSNVFTNPGTGGLQNSGGPGTGGALLSCLNSTIGKVIRFACGAGGGSGGYGVGGSSSANPGTGGRGGGVIIIECAGALNFTGTITVAGAVGGVSSGGNTGAGGGGGGGGGAGGTIIVLYTTLTMNSGTLTVSSGGGSAGSTDSGGGTGGDGGGGGGNIVAGTEGSVNAGAVGGAGGAGGVGQSLIVANTDFL